VTLLAVDAGGTHTRCAMLDGRGVLLGTGEGGPANWTTLGEAAVVEAVRAAVAMARSASGGPPVAGACVALAGYYPPWHAGAVAGALGPLLDGPLRLETDLRAAWAGATGLAPGVVVAAGTGSVAYGEDGAGKTARAGGWGPLVGDEGSGPWIGQAALRAMARQLDGRGPKTALAAQLAGARLEEWLRGIYRDGWGRNEMGALAPQVAAAALEGDPVAVGIFEEAAGELAELALRVLRALGLERGPARVSATGGVFAAGEAVARPFRRWLALTAPSVVVTSARLSPLGGAALLAMERFSAGPSSAARDPSTEPAQRQRLLEPWIENLRAGGPLFRPRR
jgi:N-acetylglucosamine kinase-like BadF-type ATPase